MNNEFPRLEDRDYQKAFLADWYTPKKLFVGERQSGKTELILSELRRFERNNLSCLLIAPTLNQLNNIESQYRYRFEEQLTAQTGTIEKLKRGSLRGYKVDCVLIDGFHLLDHNTFEHEIIPMSPTFIRASIERSSCRDKDKKLFDSVYTDE